jgi:hypothetical protein
MLSDQIGVGHTEQEIRRPAIDHVDAGRGEAGRHVDAQRGQPARPRVGLGDGFRCTARRNRLELQRAQRPVRPRRRQPRHHIRCAERVTDPQPGQRPRLGQAAQHDEVRKRPGGQGLRLARDGIGERLVDHHDPARPA